MYSWFMILVAFLRAYRLIPHLPLIIQGTRIWFWTQWLRDRQHSRQTWLMVRLFLLEAASLLWSPLHQQHQTQLQALWFYIQPLALLLLVLLLVMAGTGLKHSLLLNHYRQLLTLITIQNLI